MNSIKIKKRDLFVLIGLLVGLWGLSFVESSVFGGKTKIPTISYRLIDLGFQTEKSVLKKLDVDSSLKQPLVRLLSRPEDFYEKRVFTSGYFRMSTDKYGFLYLTKEDANLFIELNRISLGVYWKMNENLEKVDLKDFDNRYIIVSGVFSNEAGQLVIYNIDMVLDLIDLNENLYGEFSGNKFDDILKNYNPPDSTQE